jgi:hypothetical protein
MVFSPVRVRYVVAVLFAIWFAPHADAQAPTSAESFPYAFSNFVWWSDADLRAELKRRIPRLGDELTRDSAAETKIRTTLVELLKAKGVDANVQVREPDADYASHQRVPQAPPVAIIFSISSPPYISIDTISFDGAPSDISDALQKTAAVRSGSVYSTQNFWTVEDMLKRTLAEGGYLTSKVTMKPGIPEKNGNDFKVPLTALITSGPKFYVASIKANGGPLLAGRDLSPYFTLRPGDVAQPNPFARLAGTIRSTYWHAGYPDVEMHGEPVLDTEHALASYDLEVTQGPLYHLNTLNILHLDDAQQVVVNLLLKMKPGDIYDGMAMSQLSQSLRTMPSPLPGYDFGYNAKEDKAAHAVDLTLDFYKKQ